MEDIEQTVKDKLDSLQKDAIRDLHKDVAADYFNPDEPDEEYTDGVSEDD